MIATVSPLTAELETWAERHGLITIGLAGAGQMGTDILVQVSLMRGLRVGAISDIEPERVFEAARLAGLDRQKIVSASSPAAIDNAIEQGKLALVEDAALMTEAGRVHVLIDATGNPNTGAELALRSIGHAKPVVMLNVEADVTIGRFLREEARRHEVIYTGAAGDEPAAALEIIGFAQSLGLEIVAAGKGKNNPLKFDAVPADYEAEARQRNMSPRMLVEFVDGSKTMIEMVAIANATGLEPDKPGMHGPKAKVGELAQVLIPKADGGILSKRGCVDYSIGEGVAPGVFCIVQARHPRVLERMRDLKVGRGPYFTLHRPYHLTSLEVPLTVARTILHKRPDIEPLERPVAEAIAVAKRDLQPGERLGKIGESDYRGWAVTWKEARQANALPIGLAEGARVRQRVEAGSYLTHINCAADDALTLTRLRAKLDETDKRFLIS
jgi:predicted homoserine dehydrogenase-like protein